ncbi:thiol:disulfide interchange protein [Virgisporangium aliadipatigenens]|uniref:Thiol:disulfide interchange protein n=1 Tax=Virgisporangium aliadipatigenens TaxID=741659 RepID=A0A8J3YTD6_9ACTN|nr:redoxin family protein [Virgisporangium aliadipatigenens]GIJ49476.1 thiol:disulfide interchange protein [Virgisporangium aliadipatigenens]
MRARALVAVLAAIALAAGVTGCAAKTSGSSGGSPPAAESALPGPTASGTAAPVVPAGLAFKGKTVDGKNYDAAALAGKPVVLWFWAPWCGSCMGQGPVVAEVEEKYRGKVGFLGVAGLGENAAMRTFVGEAEVGAVTHLDDQTGAVWRQYGITQQSTYVLLDAGGKVIHKGWLDYDQFNEKVAALAR